MKRLVSNPVNSIRPTAFALCIFFTACSDPECYRVRFDNVDWIVAGDIVYIDSVQAGQVSDLKYAGNNSLLATICIDRRLTKGSVFTVSPGFLVFKRIDIASGNSTELIDPEEIHVGLTIRHDIDIFPESMYDSLQEVRRQQKLMEAAQKFLDTIGKDSDEKKKD